MWNKQIQQSQSHRHIIKKNMTIYIKCILINIYKWTGIPRKSSILLKLPECKTSRV